MRGSKRDRDRATEAFRRWALLGMPDPETIRRMKYKRAPEDRLRRLREVPAPRVTSADLLACASVFAMLRDSRGRSNAAGEDVIRAVTAVYMQEPWRPLRRGEVGMRATRFSIEYPADRSTVFRWLGKARRMWWELRR